MLANAISIFLALLVMLVCLIMAKKTILSNKVLDFYDEIARKYAEEKDIGITKLIIGQTKFIGIIFLGVFLSLGFFIISVIMHNRFGILISIANAIFLNIGLFLSNLNIENKLKIKTPWKESLLSVIILVVSAIMGSVPF
jgi:hypothetical protein